MIRQHWHASLKGRRRSAVAVTTLVSSEEPGEVDFDWAGRVEKPVVEEHEAESGEEGDVVEDDARQAVPLGVVRNVIVARMEPGGDQGGVPRWARVDREPENEPGPTAAALRVPPRPAARTAEPENEPECEEEQNDQDEYQAGDESPSKPQYLMHTNVQL